MDDDYSLINGTDDLYTNGTDDFYSNGTNTTDDYIDDNPDGVGVTTYYDEPDSKTQYDFFSTRLVYYAAAVAFVYCVWQFLVLSKIKIGSTYVTDERTGQSTKDADEKTGLVNAGNSKETIKRLEEIYFAIWDGAVSFLHTEYKVCIIFVLFFSVLVFGMVLLGTYSAYRSAFSTISFLMGALTSMASGYLGVKVSLYMNVRTALSAQQPDWTSCFSTAFRAGTMMAVSQFAMLVMVMLTTMLFFKLHFPENLGRYYIVYCISAYGLGASVIAMFGRVAGDIYTEAADVGADLVGKGVHGIPKDDPRNPATVANNVGDNVGDVIGMGSDIFGSVAESCCAALIIGVPVGISDDETYGWSSFCFPLGVHSIGIFVCILCSLFATYIKPVKSEEEIEGVLRLQLISSTTLMIPLVYATAQWVLPEYIILQNWVATAILIIRPYQVASCVSMGAAGALVIALVTQYFTLHSHKHVRERGATPCIIHDVALGCRYAIIPTLILAGIVSGSFALCDMYGVAFAAVGFLSNAATRLTINFFGAVSGNARAIALMAELDPAVREKTDALDAVRNTTAAIGKEFSIASAALVSFALIAAFVVRNIWSTGGIFEGGISKVLDPAIFTFLIIGGMIPFVFTAMTMKSVSTVAMEMVLEVQRQFDEKPHLLDENPTERPDYDECIAVLTCASLKQVFAPAAMIICTPILTGIIFGMEALAGLLLGSLIISTPLAISMLNSGAARKNAQQYVEKATPGSEAAVVEDTAGDSFKHTSGPALNIVMKLMASISLVFIDTILEVNEGQGVLEGGYLFLSIGLFLATITTTLIVWKFI